MKKNEIVIYPAGSMFAGGELLLNIQVAERLEKIGYRVLLPQRDGFELFDLEKIFSKNLSSEDVSLAAEDLIYLMDIGHFVARSNVVLVNYDGLEVDSGAVVEVFYAQLMGKYVLGYRTDIRGPFGHDKYGGINFFPANLCNGFFLYPMRCRSVEEADKETQGLVDKIDGILKTGKFKKAGYADRLIPIIFDVLELAEAVFDGIEDFHSEKGIEEMAKSWEINKKFFKKLRPNIF